MKKKALTPGSKPEKREPQGADSFTVVAIGASAGGLEAVTLLLQHLAPDTGMAFIYVQHLSPNHKSLLTSILSKLTKMKVQEIDDMEKMKPDNVYIIPYNKNIEVTDGHIKLIPRPENVSSNLSIDVLFSSLANARKENVIGIVLSGSANDGTRGLKEIKQAGGITFAQDDSAKYTSMPHSAIAEGVVDYILSPGEIASELNRISAFPLIKRAHVIKRSEDELEDVDQDLRAIIDILHKKRNVDFSHYKMNTIKRRILRRMSIHKIKLISKYASLLREENDALDLLHQDLLINVTEFFRDTDAFDYLKKSLLPRLLMSKSSGETLRIWVVACATGEEVYSIAMLLMELQDEENHVPFQIFASDVSLQAISKARKGEYSPHQIGNVSQERLQRFFTRQKDKFQVSKDIRDACVFAQHNILSDPPFSKMDLISCRNLMIYLEGSAQKRAISTFHYSLNDGAFLMLGKSETIGRSDELFTALDKKVKIYSRKRDSGGYKIPDITSRIFNKNMTEKNSFLLTEPKKTISSASSNLGMVLDAALLANYMPPSVIINYNMEILQFRGDTEMYLKHTSGKASFNILRMARMEIAFELRNAIHNAIKTNTTTKKTGIEMDSEEKGTAIRIINLEVTPLNVDGEEPLLLVVFSGQQIDLVQQLSKGGENMSEATSRRIKNLEQELFITRSDMSSITRDQESVNEELQSNNEEIVSSNEELQSLNEELETSKEEIESTNEELIVSNRELLARNQEVEEIYAYHEAILSTIQEPMLILDKDVRIQSANGSFYKTFRVNEEESIGVSLYKLGNNQWDIPPLRELLENIVPKNIRIQNFEVEHTFPVIGKKNMLLNAHRFIKQSNEEELIVLTILDITEVRNLAVELQMKEQKAIEKQLQQEKNAVKLSEASNKRYNMMLMQSPFAFAVLKGEEMIITLANDSVKELWGKGNDIEGKSLYEVLPEIVESKVPELLNGVFRSGKAYQGYEFLTPLVRRGKRQNVYFNFVYQPYKEEDERISGVTIIAYEVTGHVLAKNELQKAKSNAEVKTQIAEDALKAKQQFLSNMSHEIRTPMSGVIGFANAVLKTKLDPKQREYLTAIKTSGDALIVLINDILDLAKADSGKMIFMKSPFNLSALLSVVLQLFEVKLREKNIVMLKEFDERIPQVLLGDPLRLRQILLNLMSNAVKFTPKGSISINTRMHSEDAESVRVEFIVTDTGIGIPEARLEHIFNDFEQASDDTSNTYGGTGLGLAIVKQLLELQGGAIYVSSVIDKGSVFNFVLSFRKLSPGNSHEEIHEKIIPEPDFEVQNAKILVVEDIALNQLLMKIILTDFGFEYDVVENGKLAVEKLEAGSYDLVLMDIQMPVMNGIQATAYIRDHLKSDIPIIALTADVTTMGLAKCRKLGMTDYISKPIDEKLLHRKILKCLMKSVSLR
ncbi:MAG: hypothetical protein K0R65_508 [Crocinitomicaceae bacterium]|nr:hypothetical protein [Crocinitomicaceae bacterium]